MFSGLAPGRSKILSDFFFRKKTSSNLFYWVNQHYINPSNQILVFQTLFCRYSVKSIFSVNIKQNFDNFDISDNFENFDNFENDKFNNFDNWTIMMKLF